jgi:hypothetical protein
MRAKPWRALACLALPVALAVALMPRVPPVASAQNPQRPPADEPAIPLFAEPPPPTPAALRARAVLLLSTQRPEGIATLLQAAPLLDEPLAAVAAASVVGRGCQGPTVTAAACSTAGRLGLLPPSESAVAIEPDRLPPVTRAERLFAHLLTDVADDTPLPTRDRRNPEEQSAFCNILFQASQTSAQAFARGAQRDLTYATVFNESAQHRGEVVHVEGTLRLLLRWEPPRTARASGVRDLYEAWVFDPHQLGRNPWCVLFLDLPRGLKVGEKLDQQVAADGWYYKRAAYPPLRREKATQWREAPVVIARTLTPVTPPPVAVEETLDADWQRQLLYLFLGLVIASIVLAGGLGWWFRHNDRRVRQRLTAAAQRPFVEPGEQSSYYSGREEDHS